MTTTKLAFNAHIETIFTTEQLLFLLLRLEYCEYSKYWKQRITMADHSEKTRYKGHSLMLLVGFVWKSIVINSFFANDKQVT